MKKLASLVLLLGGCDLLASRNTSCADTDRCLTVVTAPFLLGQGTERAGVPSPVSFNAPVAVARVNNSLVVVDKLNHRVLMWPTLPLGADDQPTVAIGQPDLTAVSLHAADGTGLGLNAPQGASGDGTVLAVADTANARVLVWNTIPTTMPARPADLILGQPNLTSVGMNTNYAQGIGSPAAVQVSGGAIYVADNMYHRVQVWSRVPATNFATPDKILGQQAIDYHNPNQSGLGGQAKIVSLDGPQGVFVDSSAVYVSDSLNYRVMIYPVANLLQYNTPAILYLGQVSAMDNTNPMSATNLQIKAPAGISVFNNQLYVADSGFNRIAMWNLPTANDHPISSALGQSSLNVSDAGAGLAPLGLSGPSGILVTEVGIYIADTLNNRVVVLPPPKSS